MKKTIKFLLIFTILFGSLTYQTQAQAGIIKTTRNIIITGIIVTALYYATKTFGQSENENDPQAIRNLKLFARKLTFNINNTGKTINNSAKENFNFDINKFGEKLGNLFRDTKDSIIKGFDNTFLTPEQRAEKFEKKFTQNLEQMAKGDKNILTGGLELLKDGANFIKNEFNLAQKNK